MCRSLMFGYGFLGIPTATLAGTAFLWLKKRGMAKTIIKRLGGWLASQEWQCLQCLRLLTRFGEEIFLAFPLGRQSPAFLRCYNINGLLLGVEVATSLADRCDLGFCRSNLVPFHPRNTHWKLAVFL